MTDGFPRPPRLRLMLVVLAIFAAGAASGFAARSYLRPPFPMHGQPPWLRELDLTADQRKLADDIFARHREDVDVIMKDSFPKVRARNEKMEQELKAILSAEQVKKLEEIRARRRASHQGGMNGPGFDGPPRGGHFPPDPGAPPPAP